MSKEKVTRIHALLSDCKDTKHTSIINNKATKK